MGRTKLVAIQLVINNYFKKILVCYVPLFSLPPTLYQPCIESFSWEGNKRHHARFLVVLMSSQVRLIDPVSSGHSLRKQAAVQACKLNQPLSVWHCGKLQTKTDRPKKQTRKTGHSWVSTESWPDQVLWKDALKKKKKNTPVTADMAVSRPV